MENFTEIITIAESQVRLAYSLKEQNKLPQAFLLMEQAVQKYAAALYHAVDEDEEFYKALEDCAVKYAKIREQFRAQAYSSLTDVDVTINPEDCPSSCHQEDNVFDNKMLRCTSGFGFGDIIGLSYLKEIFFNCIIMLPTSRYAQRFSERGGGGFDQHILLYGSPGNGKTEIVRSYHHEAKGTSFYMITPADVLSKYIGESEKNLDLLFKSAQKNTPSMIFFDEIDGLFSGIRRDGNTISVLNQFLQLMEMTPGVQVIGATNVPWEIPDSILRRFTHIVHVPLPNKEERVRLLAKCLGTDGIQVNLGQLQTIAEITKGYSCSDLKRVAKAAIRIPQATVIKAKFFKEIDGENKWTPCSEVEKGAVRMSFMDVEPTQIEFPKVQIADLRKAVSSNSMTTQPIQKGGENLKQTLEFSAKMGTDGRDGDVRGLSTNSSIACWVGDGKDFRRIEILACGQQDNKVEKSKPSDTSPSGPNEDGEIRDLPEKDQAKAVPGKDQKTCGAMAIFRLLFHRKRGNSE